MNPDRKNLWRKWIGGVGLLLAVLLILPNNWRPFTTNRLSLMVMKGVLLHLPPVAGSETIRTDFQGLSVEKRARLLGSLLLSQGEYEAARTALSQGVNVSQPDPLVLVFLAEANDRLGEEQAALDTWKQAGAITQLINRGKQAEQSGNSQLAGQFYQAALELDPNNPLAINAKVRLYEKMGDLAAASETLRQMLNEAPEKKTPSLFLQLGFLLEKQQRWSEAEEIYRQAVGIYPQNHQAHISHAYAIYQANHVLDQAIAEIDAVIAQDPKNVDAYITLGKIYRLEKDYTQALSNIDHAILLAEDPYWSLILKSEILIEIGEIPDAVHLLEETALRFPDRPHVFYVLASGYHQIGDLNQALSTALRAVELDNTDSLGYRYMLARVYEARGEINEAIATYQSILSLKPDDEMALQAIKRLQNP